MASARVNLVRTIYAAWERGDFRSTEWADPGIEYVIADGPAPGRLTGLAGMAAAYRDWLSAWVDYRVQADEYRELDDERVFVFTHAGGRGKISGLEIPESRTAGGALFHIRDRKVTRLVLYFDRERALADLGLASDGDLPR
jgi:ketosteroid isomerase-like protein